MKISMYTMSADSFLPMLKNLQKLLEKGAAHADARKFDTGVLCASRLAPDMFPLTKQIQIATDFAKGASARLAGVEPPKFEDNETSYADLQARIQKTIDFLGTLAPASFEGSEDRDITITVPGKSWQMKGLLYLKSWALPNFYFHYTTAYNLLRHNGVEIGKRDFLGE